MKKQIAPLVAVLSILLAVCSVTASEEVSIRFPRSVVGVSQHGNLLIVVNYKKDDRNRELILAWDSEAECGSSSVEINAENNGIPVAKDLVLSAGEYVFMVTLYRSDGSKSVDIQNRMVTE